MLQSQRPDPSRIQIIQSDQDVQVCGWNMVERCMDSLCMIPSLSLFSFFWTWAIFVSFFIFLSCFEHGFISTFFLHSLCLFCKDTFGERGHNTCGVLFGGWMNGIILASNVEV
jgi:hypothetical protein